MTLSFESLPQQVSFLTQEIAELKKLLTARDEPDPLPDFLSLDQLINYLPSHPAKQTIYGLVSTRKIPVHRINGKLFFNRKEIDQWLKSKRRKTQADINKEAENFLNKR